MTGQSFAGTWEESRDQSIQIPQRALWKDKLCDPAISGEAMDRDDILFCGGASGLWVQTPRQTQETHRFLENIIPAETLCV